jgi:hypothetical protein
VRHTLLCRTFGAQLINNSLPGLTAGPIDYRSFGPPDTNIIGSLLNGRAY